VQCDGGGLQARIQIDDAARAILDEVADSPDKRE
jgi:hypothetical protein